MSGQVEGLHVQYSGDASGAVKAGQDAAKSVQQTAQAIGEAGEAAKKASATSALFGTTISKNVSQATGEIGKMRGAIGAVAGVFAGMPSSVMRVGQAIQAGFAAFAVGGPLAVGVAAIAAAVVGMMSLTQGAPALFEDIGRAALGIGPNMEEAQRRASTALDEISKKAQDTARELRNVAITMLALQVGRSPDIVTKEVEIEEAKQNFGRDRYASIAQGTTSEAQFVERAVLSTGGDANAVMQAVAIRRQEELLEKTKELHFKQYEEAQRQAANIAAMAKLDQDASKAKKDANKAWEQSIESLNADAYAPLDSIGLAGSVEHLVIPMSNLEGEVSAVDAAINSLHMREFVGELIEMEEATQQAMRVEKELAAARWAASKQQSENSTAGFQSMIGVTANAAPAIDAASLGTAIGSAAGLAMVPGVGQLIAGPMEFMGGMFERFATAADTPGPEAALAGGAAFAALFAPMGIAIGAVLAVALTPLTGGLSLLLAPVLALVGGMFALLPALFMAGTYTKAFSSFAMVAGHAMTMLLEPLGILWQQLWPVAGAMVQFAASMAPVVALLMALVPLSPIVDLMIWALTGLTKAFLMSMAFLGDAMEELFRIQHENTEGGNDDFRRWDRLQDTATDALKDLDKAPVTAETGFETFLDTYRQLTEENTKATEDNSKVIDETFNRNMRNMPLGDKMFQGMEFAAASPTIHIGELVLPGVSDARGFTDALQSMARNGTRAPNRGRGGTGRRN